MDDDSFAKSEPDTDQYAKIKLFRCNVVESQIAFYWARAYYLNIRQHDHVSYNSRLHL